MPWLSSPSPVAGEEKDTGDIWKRRRRGQRIEMERKMKGRPSGKELEVLVIFYMSWITPNLNLKMEHFELKWKMEHTELKQTWTWG